MPRSVNHVASRAKRKKILKLTRGYFGARKNVIEINRKVLADLAMNNPAAFKAIVDEAKKHA